MLRLGINEWPVPGRIVKRDTYIAEYHALVQKDGEPFFPYAAQKDLVFAGLIILALVVTAAVMGPIGPNGEPDPAIIQTVPRPDFFFLWLFSVFALLPPWTETVLMLTGPVAAIGLLFLVPFISGAEGEKSPLRRPITVMILVLTFMAIGILIYLGTFSPWSPHMEAWSGTPTPVDDVRGRTPLELQGAVEIQAKQCAIATLLGGQGGERGPALDTTATRLTQDQIVRQILQGGGNVRLMDITSVRRRSTPWWPSWKPCIRPTSPRRATRRGPRPPPASKHQPAPPARSPGSGQTISRTL